MKADKVIQPYKYIPKDIAIDKITYFLDGKHTIPSAWGDNIDKIAEIEMLNKSIYPDDENNELLFNMLWEASFCNNPDLSAAFNGIINFKDFNSCVQFTQIDGSWGQFLIKI